MMTRVGNLDVHFELEGPEGAPVVTFVHGLAASLEIWAGQAERLCDRFRVLRYDLRAHGQSDTATAPFSMLADLIDVLDTLKIPKAALVGLSAGSTIALSP